MTTTSLSMQLLLWCTVLLLWDNVKGLAHRSLYNTALRVFYPVDSTESMFLLTWYITVSVLPEPPVEQESPPAWPQEAYHRPPPFAVLSREGVTQSYPGQGVLQLRPDRGRCPCPGLGGFPVLSWLGVPPVGTRIPPGRTRGDQRGRMHTNERSHVKLITISSNGPYNREERANSNPSTSVWWKGIAKIFLMHFVQKN